MYSLDEYRAYNYMSSIFSQRQLIENYIRKSRIIHVLCFDCFFTFKHPVEMILIIRK